MVKDGEERLRLDDHGERMCRGLRADWSGTKWASEVEEGIFVSSHDGGIDFRCEAGIPT